MKLFMPVICDCGFSTMDAREAVGHAKKHETSICLTCIRRGWCKAATFETTECNDCAEYGEEK